MFVYQLHKKASANYVYIYKYPYGKYTNSNILQIKNILILLIKNILYY